MRIAIKQNFVRGPLDGSTRWKSYDCDDIQHATDARPPCVFADDGSPKWCAWYSSDWDDVITGGTVNLYFEDYCEPSATQMFVYSQEAKP